MPKKCVILAGGLGTRLGELTEIKPKPMIEIGGHPLLWHIMKTFSFYGVREFVVCLGYKGTIIKEYFANLNLRSRNFSVDLQNGKIEFLDDQVIDWRIELVDTGLETPTAGRIQKVQHLLPNEFFLTYGDGLANIDLRREVEYHHKMNRLVTICAVPQPGRFGILDVSQGGEVLRFAEKAERNSGWINGGFMILKKESLGYIESLDDSLEIDVLPKIALAGELAAFRHEGFWQPCDTISDVRKLESLLKKNGENPWSPR